MRNSYCFVLLLLCSVRGHAQSAELPTFRINPQRLQGTLEKLSEFGRNPEGGVTRLGFSETDLAAREYVTGLMRQAGVEVRVDPAGNIFGLRAGSEKLPILLFGSHIDSVLHGGNFDGDVGSMGAIEIMRALNDGGVKTRHPLEAVIWTNEEGNHFGIGTLGSGVAAGSLGPEILERKDEQGLTLADWLRRYGQNPAHVTDARIPPGALTAYLELHIEQGPNLYETKVPIGIVQGIVGIKRWNCVVTGFANHAGTTPMNRRKDALAAASKDVLAVRDVVRAEEGSQVGNVGYVKVAPGAINVIPGRAEFPVELRDLDAANVDRMWEHIQQRFAEVDKAENVETRCSLLDRSEPARADPSLQAALRQAAKSLGLATADLPSLRWARRARDCPDRPDGDDLCPQQRGHQPLPQGVHVLARRSQRNRSPLQVDIAAGRATGQEVIGAVVAMASDACEPQI
jgi:N-carbamoyl-L-amino-acid hydrolase